VQTSEWARQWNYPAETEKTPQGLDIPTEQLPSPGIPGNGIARLKLKRPRRVWEYPLRMAQVMRRGRFSLVARSGSATRVVCTGVGQAMELPGPLCVLCVFA